MAPLDPIGAWWGQAFIILGLIIVFLYNLKD
jgi:hypothetical protein